MLFNLIGQKFDLLVGDGKFALQMNRQAPLTGVLELCVLDPGVALQCGGKRGTEVRALLQRGEDGASDFVAQHVADGSGAEELPQRTVGFDPPDIGHESKF